MCVCRMCTSVLRDRPEGSLSFSEAGFMEDYELPDVCAGDWLWMLWKSQPQSPLSQWASLRPQQVRFIKPLFPSSPFSFSFIWGKYLLFFWVDYLLASISKNWIIYICFFLLLPLWTFFPDAQARIEVSLFTQWPFFNPNFHICFLPVPHLI